MKITILLSFQGRELFIIGNFFDDNADASDTTTYPIFQVETETLECTPNPPQNGHPFLCKTLLPSTITNHTLTMSVVPDAAFQPFQIDYLRYGSSSQVAQATNQTALYVQSPDNSTLGLSLEGSWENQTIGGANDIQGLSAMQTSTLSSKAIYNFVGM